MNAWNHYQRYGKSEGRIWPNLEIVKDSYPSNCDVSSAIYLAIYPDVAKVMNAWDHYQTYGENEGRIWPGCKSSF